MRKGVQYSGKPLITLTKQYNGQIEVGERRWLTIPPQTRDKLMTIRIVSANMHLPLVVLQRAKQSQEGTLEFG